MTPRLSPARLLAASALCVAPALSGCALLGRTPAPAAPPRPLAEALAYPELAAVEVPAVRRVELPNGLVVLLVEDRRLPVVRARARIGGGSLLDPPDHAGLASVAATVLRSGGAGDRPADALNLALESAGASVEASAGDESVTVSMRALSETVDEVLPLFADVLRAPRFDGDALAVARRQQRSAIGRRNDDPQGVATRELFRALYGADSPYGQQTEYWTVDAIDRDDLAAWHARTVVPANTSIAVWGDFDADAMTARLQDAFGDWRTPDGWAATPTPAPPAAAAARVLYVERPDVNQSTVLIGHLASVRYDDPDYPALVVMNEILGGGFSGRLLRTVRTDLGYAYSVFGVYGAGYEHPDVFYSGTNTKSESTVAAALAMLDVIRGLQAAPPTDAEMALARDSYLNSFVFNYDTRAEVLGRRQTYDAYGYPADFLETLRDRVLAVTPADVQRVAQAHLRPDEATLLVVGNGAAFDRPVTALGAVDTLDVRIPLVPEAGAAVAGDAEGGRRALDALAARLGGDATFDALTSIQSTGETRATVEGREIAVGTTVRIRFPDAVRVEQRLPDGAEVAVVVTAEGALVATPVGRQAAPPAVVEQIRAQQFLSLPVLLARRAEVGAERMPSAEGTLLRLTLPGQPTPLLLRLDADGLPVDIASTQQTQAGPAEVVVTLSDFRDVDGYRLPFRYSEAANGVPGSVTQLDAITVNPAFDAALFDVRR